MYSYFKKIYSCISKRDKKYVVPIIILILLNTLIELVGIGAFIPLINIILSPESYDTNKFLVFLLNSNILSNFDIPSILILLIIIFFLFRFFFQSFYFLIIQKFLHKVSLNLSSNLINIYMKQPIQISLKSKPSTMFKNLYTEVNTLKSQTLIMIKFVSDLILSLAIFSILIFFNPVITIVAILSLFSFFLLYLFFSKNYTLLLGSKRFYHNEYLSNILTECFNSLREIKLFNMYKYFNKNFLFHKDVDGWSKIKSLFLRQLPIFFIELLVVIIFSIIIIYSLKINYNTDQLIITLGFYAICFIRLLPLVNKISETYQSYKFSKVAIEKIYDDYQKRISVKLDDDLNLNQTEIPFNKNIKIKNLKFNYNEKSEFNIDVKEFIINKNEYMGIYGNSGSGKSTFVDLISGLTKPHSGNIYSDELDIYENLSLWRKKIGYVPQNIYLLDDTIENNICIIDKIDTSFKDKNYFEEILKMCDLIELYQDYKENSIGEGGSRISGGQKQRIGIARALYKKPEILILDEPTSSLDLDTEKKFLSSLKKLKNKITIIHISHKLETFKDSDRVIKIVNGKIYEN